MIFDHPSAFKVDLHRFGLLHLSHHVGLGVDTLERYWENKPLIQFTPEEWEALCDGCGRCCLLKLRRPSTGKVDYTRVACRLLDLSNCRCLGYHCRHAATDQCLEMTPDNISTLRWLPKSCAYRLVAQGRPLPDWHPLISGDSESVHRAGASIRGKALSEKDISPDNLERYLLSQRP
jgi:uncharacterized cysteine cluster protein YcgN (CxxCxxCC family)